MFWLTDHCHKERVINCQQAPLARRWCNTPKTSVYIYMKHLTLIKVRTADPTWLLYNTSVYKNRFWKIKDGDQFLEILVSPCLSSSNSGWVSIWSVELPSLLILPGLLRSYRGGLSVSSPSGERKDACGLRKWCKLLVLSFIGFPRKPSYSASFLHWIFLLSYPHSITLYISN